MERGPYHNVYLFKPSRRQIADEALCLIYSGLDILETLKPDPVAEFMTRALNGILEAAAQYSDELLIK